MTKVKMWLLKISALFPYKTLTPLSNLSSILKVHTQSSKIQTKPTTLNKCK